MEAVQRSAVSVFTKDSYPNNSHSVARLVHEAMSFGISIYRGIIVIWDEDHDARILRFVDNLTNDELKYVIAVHERKGSLSIVYREHLVPNRRGTPRLFSGKYEFLVDEDCWPMMDWIDIDVEGFYG